MISKLTECMSSYFSVAHSFTLYSLSVWVCMCAGGLCMSISLTNQQIKFSKPLANLIRKSKWKMKRKHHNQQTRSYRPIHAHIHRDLQIYFINRLPQMYMHTSIYVLHTIWNRFLSLCLFAVEIDYKIYVLISLAHTHSHGLHHHKLFTWNLSSN